MTATGADVTRVTEDYLALIWKACEWPDDGRRPNTTDLAAALGVTPSTVSASLKRLAREGMIKYRPYGNIELTEEGERIGRAVVRRHRIIETYLVTSLGMPWDQVHDEADRLEHAASEALVDRMDEILGHPAADPHGDPIPDASGRISFPHTVPLSQCEPGETVVLERINDSDPKLLRYLSEHGFTPGAHLAIEEGAPFSEAINVRVVAPADAGAASAQTPAAPPQTTVPLGAAAATDLFVSRP